jgi:hypothetical protein
MKMKMKMKMKKMKKIKIKINEKHYLHHIPEDWPPTGIIAQVSFLIIATSFCDVPKIN